MAQTQTLTARTTPPVARRRPLNWLLALNAAWTERRRLERLDAAAMKDLGLTREEVSRTSVADIAVRMRLGL